jgi:hypothetical protein
MERRDGAKAQRKGGGLNIFIPHLRLAHRNKVIRLNIGESIRLAKLP